MKEMQGKVLIVEDNVSNGIAALSAMKELGYESMILSNAEDAVKMIKKEDFLGVLTDMRMPLKRNDSVNSEAGKVVVQECAERAIPVVVITGGTIGHHNVPGITVLVPHPIISFDSEKVFLVRTGEIAGEEKDVNAWKYAWQILSDQFALDVVEMRRRYRKHLGKGFKLK